MNVKKKRTLWNVYDSTEEPTNIPPLIKEKGITCKHYLERSELEFNYYLYRRRKRVQQTRKLLVKHKFNEKKTKMIISEVFNNETEFLRRQRTKILVEDYITLAKIGQGTFGEVFLVKKKPKNKSKSRKRENENEEEDDEDEDDDDEEDEEEEKDSGNEENEKGNENENEKENEINGKNKKEKPKTYALKRVKKSRVKSLSQMKNIWTEREVLAIHNSPWLVKLYESFQDDEYLYFVMDYHSGGDLKCLLQEVGALTEDATRFYMAEMLLTVEDLHNQGFIHRDLKPENFLISSNGHLKLTDFGLSKNIYPDKKNWKETIERISQEEMNNRKHFTFVGTPNYMSPEILSRKGYDKSVDFWSLGCILYELLAGIPPFSGNEIEETLRNIMFYTKTLTPPVSIDDEEIIEKETWDLITTLLDVPLKEDPKVFLQNLKKHPFFDGIDWGNLRNSTPPFVPMLENEMDISYFNTSYFGSFDGELTTVIKNFSKPNSFSKRNVNNKFVGFTFRRYDD
ncbi:cell cycle protein kinase dbf2-related [Anaeramoeba flamelloides]|uniref:non-specific serine/threonine protein kinase n=1 Tax=Anaeramoeba flamelloides TaxID=1746091 RepID=A0AAV8ABD7_9EUKA|nr:cell cycle protein kinase dbf2-related [Anaeramoeba flamelloides]